MTSRCNVEHIHDYFPLTEVVCESQTSPGNEFRVAGGPMLYGHAGAGGLKEGEPAPAARMILFGIMVGVLEPQFYTPLLCDMAMEILANLYKPEQASHAMSLPRRCLVTVPRHCASSLPRHCASSLLCRHCLVTDTSQRDATGH